VGFNCLFRDALSEKYSNACVRHVILILYSDMSNCLECVDTWVLDFGVHLRCAYVRRRCGLLIVISVCDAWVCVQKSDKKRSVRDVCKCFQIAVEWLLQGAIERGVYV